MNRSKLKKLSVAVCLGAALLISGCHKKTPASPPPPPPPQPPAAPTANISISPLAIHPGESATLIWNTTNATQTSITGIGTVPASGSQSVAPTVSTTYNLVAKGAGGTVEEAARLTVNPAPSKPTPPPPSATDEQLFEQNIKDAYFDYDKYTMRPQDSTVAQEDASFLAKHPAMKIVIEGHCDERGSEEYNIALGHSRAESFKTALVNDGVPSSSIRVISVGKEKPFCTDSNEQCWQQNRRAHLKLDR